LGRRDVRFGSEADMCSAKGNVRFGSKADICGAQRHVRFTPKGGHQVTYSITSSARASSEGDTDRPSAFAVFRLITSSYLVGACTGRLAGFSPLRMRSA